MVKTNVYLDIGTTYFLFHRKWDEKASIYQDIAVLPNNINATNRRPREQRYCHLPQQLQEFTRPQLMILKQEPRKRTSQCSRPSSSCRWMAASMSPTFSQQCEQSLRSKHPSRHKAQREWNRSSSTIAFEGMIDFTEFSIFVSVSNTMRPKWLTNYSRNIPKQQNDEFRRNLAGVQPIFEYENSHHSSTGSAPEDGAVNHIWKKIHQKLPMIQEAVAREKRKPEGASILLWCHCTWASLLVADPPRKLSWLHVNYYFSLVVANMSM